MRILVLLTLVLGALTVETPALVIGYLSGSNQSFLVADFATQLLNVSLGINFTTTGFSTQKELMRALVAGNICATLDYPSNLEDLGYSAWLYNAGPLGFTYKAGWFIPMGLATSQPEFLTWKQYENFNTVLLNSSQSAFAALLTQDLSSTEANQSLALIDRYNLKIKLTKATSSSSRPALYLIKSPSQEIVSAANPLARVFLPPCLKKNETACDFSPEIPTKFLHRGLAEKYQSAANILSKIHLSETSMNELLSVKASVWLSQNREIWTLWFPLSPSCPPGQHLEGIECVDCPVHTFYANGTCLSCPNHGECSGGISPPIASVGFWAPASASPSIIFYPCFPRHACELGGVCAHGKTGVLCADCEPHFFHLMGHCSDCNLFSSNYKKVTPVFAILVIALWVLIHHMTAGVLDAFEISLLFLQMTQIIGTFHVNWPAGVGDMFSYLSFIVFETDLVSPSCYATEHWTFYNRFFLQNFMPLIVFVALFVKGYISIYFLRRNHAGETTDSFWTQFKREVAMSCETFLNISYPLLVGTALNVFNCNKIDGVSVLVAQPSLECWTGDHNTLAFFAFLSLAVYTVGIPAFFAFILFRANRLHQFNDPIFRQVHGWLYLRFEDEYFFWELTFLFRKFCFVFISVFIETGAVQLISSLIVILGFIMMHVYARPFDDTELDYLESLYLLLLAGFTVSGVMFELAAGDSDLSMTFKIWNILIWIFLGTAGVVTFAAAAANIYAHISKTKLRKRLRAQVQTAILTQNLNQNRKPPNSTNLEMVLDYLCDTLSEESLENWSETEPNSNFLNSVYRVASALAAKNKMVGACAEKIDFNFKQSRFFRQLFKNIPSVIDFILAAPPPEAHKAALVLSQMAKHFAGSTPTELDLAARRASEMHSVARCDGNGEVEKLRGFLEKNKYFLHLDADEISTLACTMARISAEPGDVLFNEGDTDETFYVIISGKINIIAKPSENSAGVSVANLEAGASFGELEFSFQNSRYTGAVAETRSILYTCTKSVFNFHQRNFSAKRPTLSEELNQETGYMILQFAVDANLSCQLKPGEVSVGCCLCSSDDALAFSECDLEHDSTGAGACEALMRDHFMQLRGLVQALYLADQNKKNSKNSKKFKNKSTVAPWREIATPPTSRPLDRKRTGRVWPESLHPTPEINSHQFSTAENLTEEMATLDAEIETLNFDEEFHPKIPGDTALRQPELSPSPSGVTRSPQISPRTGVMPAPLSAKKSPLLEPRTNFDDIEDLILEELKK